MIRELFGTFVIVVDTVRTYIEQKRTTVNNYIVRKKNVHRRRIWILFPRLTVLSIVPVNLSTYVKATPVKKRRSLCLQQRRRRRRRRRAPRFPPFFPERESASDGRWNRWRRRRGGGGKDAAAAAARKTRPTRFYGRVARKKGGTGTFVIIIAAKSADCVD